MFRLISAAATAGLLAGLATAQTITAPEGNWAWQAELDMNGLKLANKGSECITADNAELDLAEAVLSIDEACSIFGWNPGEEATHFALACLGDQAADMAGVLTFEGEEARLSLKGDVRLGEASPLKSFGTITATRTGACAVPEAVNEAEAELVEAAVEVVETEEVAVEAVVEVAETTDETVEAELVKVEADAEVVEVEIVEAQAETVEAEASETVAALPTPILVAEAPIVKPIPVEEDS